MSIVRKFVRISIVHDMLKNNNPIAELALTFLARRDPELRKMIRNEYLLRMIGGLCFLGVVAALALFILINQN